MQDSLQGKVEVKLLDAGSQTQIVGTVLSKESPGVLVDGYRYKAVEPYLLPRGFQGQIIAENGAGSTAELPVTRRDVNVTLNNGGNVLKVGNPISLQVFFKLLGMYMGNFMNLIEIYNQKFLGAKI